MWGAEFAIKCTLICYHIFSSRWVTHCGFAQQRRRRQKINWWGQVGSGILLYGKMCERRDLIAPKTNRPFLLLFAFASCCFFSFFSFLNWLCCEEEEWERQTNLPRGGKKGKGRWLWEVQQQQKPCCIFRRWTVEIASIESIHGHGGEGGLTPSMKGKVRLPLPAGLLGSHTLTHSQPSPWVFFLYRPKRAFKCERMGHKSWFFVLFWPLLELSSPSLLLRPRGQGHYCLYFPFPIFPFYRQ